MSIYSDATCCINSLERTNKKLMRENKKLKEILLACRNIMIDCIYKLNDESGHCYADIEVQLRAVIKDINTVICESEEHNDD